MIAACPKCSARYRIEKGRLRPEGARLRCSRCEAVFRVRPPDGETAPAAPAPAATPAAAPEARPEISRPRARESAAPADELSVDRERLVLVADSAIDAGKATASALASWGLQPILVHDGVEAILTIQRTMPFAVIIDAALPKMYGFQICELLKRNESLRHIHVVLVGAIHDRNRYRRSPSELYGADAYLERPQLPDSLWPILNGFGAPLTTGAPAEEPRPAAATAGALSEAEGVEARPAPPAAAPAPAVPGTPSPAPAPVEAPVFAPSAAPAPVSAPPPAASAADAAYEAEVAKAERLARIVVSDIILYNQEKFDAALLGDDVLAAMDDELAEGRALFAQRIDARVRGSRDFLAEELLRVAGMRRSQ